MATSNFFKNFVTGKIFLIPATPEEFAPLFNELKALDYNLDIIKKHRRN